MTYIPSKRTAIATIGALLFAVMLTLAALST